MNRIAVFETGLRRAIGQLESGHSRYGYAVPENVKAECDRRKCFSFFFCVISYYF